MYEPENFEAALARVRTAVMQHDGQTKSGAHLHEIITQSVPDLDIRAVVEIPVGPGALKTFIEAYLSDVISRIGNKGNDILYAIGHSNKHPVQYDESPNIWKAFVSPSTNNFLFFNADDMSLRAEENKPLNDNLKPIDKVSQEEHYAIRSNFTDALNENQRELLGQRVLDDGSYDSFVQGLRSSGLIRLWGNYRRDAFEKLLAGRLEKINVDSAHIPAIVSQLQASQQALFRQRQTMLTTDAATPLSQPSARLPLSERFYSPSTPNSNSVRWFAQQVIGQMEDHDIRSMQFPLGAMIDALNSRK